MAFTNIASPNDPFHWIDAPLAQAWLQRALQLSSPATAGNSGFAVVRDNLNNSGPGKQLLGLTAAWQALHNYYRALDLTPGSEAIYVNAFKEAYGPSVVLTDNTISAAGSPPAGWIPQHAIDAIRAAGVQTAIPGNARWIVRAFVTPDGREVKIVCPEGRHCTDIDNRELSTYGGSSQFSQCGQIGDWRCTYWQGSLGIILPSLVESMNLLYTIATRLNGLNPTSIVQRTTADRGRAISIFGTDRNIPPPALPSPPDPGSIADLFSTPVSVNTGTSTSTPPSTTTTPLRVNPPFGGQGSTGMSNTAPNTPTVTPVGSGPMGMPNTLTVTPLGSGLTGAPSTTPKAPNVTPVGNVTRPVTQTPSSILPTGSDTTSYGSYTPTPATNPMPTSTPSQGSSSTGWWIAAFVVVVAGGVWWYDHQKK